MNENTDLAVQGARTHTAALDRFSAGALAMSDVGMDRMLRVAEMMATARCTVPQHLRGSVGDCLAVVTQAMQWGMSPFAVAQKTHIVNGALGYEAQLVIAVVQASGAINGAMRWEFRGDGASVSCRAGAVLRGHTEVTWGEWLSASSVTTKNSPLWKTNPKQQLAYLQAKNWARLYAPGAILGVYTPDELEIAAPIAPRHMGAAQTVEHPLPPSLLEAAENAAADGVSAYEAFWKASSKEARLALKAEHGRLKQRALDADAARTVDMGDQATEPAFDVEQLLQRIQACTDVAVLQLIGDDVATLPAGPQREQLERAIVARDEELAVEGG